jgi:hypothetical protein
MTGGVRAALAVAATYPVFPCDPNTKRPLTQHGFQEATRERAQIERWWRAYPHALIGVPTGAASGLLAIDIDPKAGDWFQANKHKLGRYRLHQTRRGKHLLYRFVPGVTNSTQVAGIDVRGEGGYIIYWPAHGMLGFGEPGELPPGLLPKKTIKPNGHAREEESVDWGQERARVIQALAQLDPDMSHDEWRDVAASLSWATGGNQDGEDIFVDFSKGKLGAHASVKFAEKETEDTVRKKYRSFKNDKARNVTLATLYQMVKDAKGHVPAGRPEKKKNAQDGEPHFKRRAFQVDFEALGATQNKNIAVKRCYIGEWLKPGAWLVVGRPKIGKSWLLMQMLMDLGRGRAFVGYKTDLREGEEVLAFFSEDDEARLKTRSLTYGKAPGCIKKVNREEFLKLARANPEGDFPAWLDGYLKAHPMVKVIVIDTEETTRFVWRDKEAQQKRDRITVVDYEQTSKFDQIAQRHNAVILLVNHSKKMHLKNGEGFDIHEIINRTNTALAGASGSIVMADLPDADRLDPTEKRRLLGVRGRDVEEEVLIVLNRNGTRFVNEGEYHAIEQTQAEQEFLRELLEWHENGDLGEGEFASTKELAAKLSIRADGLRHTIAKMIKSGRTTWKGYRIVTRTGRNGGVRLDKLG